MMIYLYSGTPGSGKSLHLAKDIFLKLLIGGNIVANFDVNRKLIKKRKGKFFYFDNTVLTVKRLYQYAQKHHIKGKESQTLLIIDECSIMFNSREYGKTDRMDWIKFFQLHRKLGFNIILCSQSDRLIDRQIRAFIEYDCKHRKLNNFGAIGFILSLFRIPLFISVTYWYGVRERVGSEVFAYRKKYGEFYDTTMIFS